MPAFPDLLSLRLRIYKKIRFLKGLDNGGGKTPALFPLYNAVEPSD